MKKYELTEKTIVGSKNVLLHQIRALKDFDNIKAGDLGGWIEREENLSQEGNCWIRNRAWVAMNARVIEDAQIYGNSYVFGNAEISGKSHVYGNARIYGNCKITDNSRITDASRVFGNAVVSGSSNIYGGAWISGEALIEKSRDFISITNISEWECLTFYRCKDNSVGMTSDIFTMHKLKEMIQTNEDLQALITFMNYYFIKED